MLSPEAYLESLRKVADSITLEEEGWVLDAGSGPGLILPYLSEQLGRGGRYLGMDILPAGLASLKSIANQRTLNIFGVQADLTKDLPLKDRFVSCVVAHFSIYTLPEKKHRKQVYREIYRIVKSGGLLVTANPTHTYSAKQIIRASLECLKSQGRPWRLKALFVYPLTLSLGLKHIERQLQSGKWHGYQPEELCEEIAEAGFLIERSETVYGGSGFLVVGRKP